MFRGITIAAMLLAHPMALATPETRQLVFGGEQAIIDRYPYYTDIVPDNLDACGGTLVAPDMILVHPQCSPFKAQVNVGWYNANAQSAGDPIGVPLGNDASSVASDALFVHPLYDKDTFEYGFLLVKLAAPSSRAFAKLNSNAAVPSADTPLHVLGRGSSQSGDINLRNRLYEAPVPFVDKDTCEKSKTHGGQTFLGMIQDSLICAGSDDYSPCEFDWGGPLVIQGDIPEDDILVGITAWSFGCGPPMPGVFSNVASGFDWMRSTICNESNNPPAYLNCNAGTDVQISPSPSPPPPTKPIKFKWTFTVDDFSFDNAYTLERIDGLDVAKVDYTVPGAIPPIYQSTYEHESQIEEGGLYSVTISDANKDGLYIDDGGINFFLGDEEEQIHTEDAAFSQGINFLFYATLGEVENAYNTQRTFSDGAGAILQMEIQFDDYPWEIGWQLETTQGEVVIYRPPRYYYREVGRKETEEFPVPKGDKNYKLTFVDTFGDGLLGGSTYYRLYDPDGDILVESQFRDIDKEEKTFRYNAGGITYESSANHVQWGASVFFSVFGIFCSAVFW